MSIYRDVSSTNLSFLFLELMSSCLCLYIYAAFSSFLTSILICGTIPELRLEMRPTTMTCCMKSWGNLFLNWQICYKWQRKTRLRQMQQVHLAIWFATLTSFVKTLCLTERFRLVHTAFFKYCENFYLCSQVKFALEFCIKYTSFVVWV